MQKYWFEEKVVTKRTWKLLPLLYRESAYSTRKRVFSVQMDERAWQINGLRCPTGCSRRESSDRWTMAPALKQGILPSLPLPCCSPTPTSYSSTSCAASRCNSTGTSTRRTTSTRTCCRRWVPTRWAWSVRARPPPPSWTAACPCGRQGI